MIDKAIIAGSFDPPTKGHLDLIARTAKISKSVIVALATNEEKAPLLPFDLRYTMLQSITASFANVTVTKVEGMLATFAQKEQPAILIRGIREEKDLAHEALLANYNRNLIGIETLLLLADPSLSKVSSSFLKSSKANDQDYKNFLPKELYDAVAPLLKEKKQHDLQ